jgi:hypothetical protein
MLTTVSRPVEAQLTAIRNQAHADATEALRTLSQARNAPEPQPGPAHNNWESKILTARQDVDDTFAILKAANAALAAFKSSIVASVVAAERGM